MKIDYKAAFIWDADNELELYRSGPNEREMQSLALKVGYGYALSLTRNDVGRLKTYFGYWPMFLAEALVYANKNEPFDNLVMEFAKGMVELIHASQRRFRHIPFTESVLLWDYFVDVGAVKEISTQEMIGTVLTDLSKRPHFQRVLTDVLALNLQSSVENHSLAMPAINGFLASHPEITEPMMTGLKPDCFSQAMELFDKNIWMPYSNTSVRRDMMLSRDLGL